MDVFVKKYDEFMKAREGGGAAGALPQQQPPQMAQGEGSQ